MNAILASVESRWYFSSARMNSCLAAGYFAARKVEVEHQEIFGGGRVADVCNFPSKCSEKLRAPPSFLRETLAELYLFVCNSYTGVNEQCVLTIFRLSGAQF